MCSRNSDHTETQPAENQARFVRILSAATLLTDPIQRAAYDRSHTRGTMAAGRPATPSTSSCEPSSSTPPFEKFDGGDQAAWVAEYDRLVAWFYRREPLI